jgi:hypothetical protein
MAEIPVEKEMKPIFRDGRNQPGLPCPDKVDVPEMPHAPVKTGTLASIKWGYKLYKLLTALKSKGGSGAMKAGWKTTEFWIALVATLLGLGMSSGLLPSTFPQGDVSSATENIAGAVVAIAAIIRYLNSRTEVKKAALNQPVK